MGAVATAAGLAGCGSQSGSDTTDTGGQGSSPTATPQDAGGQRNSPTATPQTTAQTDRAELRARIDELETRVAELREELGSKEGDITALEEDIASKEEEIASLESDLEALQTEVDDKSTRIAELEASIEEKERRIEELESGSGESDFSEDVLETVRAEAKKTREAVVVIRGDDGGGGTAWFHEDGHLITNSHVVDGGAPFEAWTLGGETFEPELLGRSVYLDQPYEDVAVLDADISPPSTLSMGESSSLEEDQPVFQVGHPGVLGNWVVSIGRFVKTGFGDTLLTTVPGLQGNSGSALMTESGNVVGILSGEIAREQSSSSKPTPSEFEIKEEFDPATYASHDKTDVIEKYVEQFG